VGVRGQVPPERSQCSDCGYLSSIPHSLIGV
jgi:hypothetical protein